MLSGYEGDKSGATSNAWGREDWVAGWLTIRLHPVSKFLQTWKGPNGTSKIGTSFCKKEDSWNPREGAIPAWNPILPLKLNMQPGVSKPTTTPDDGQLFSASPIAHITDLFV